MRCHAESGRLLDVHTVSLGDHDTGDLNVLCDRIVVVRKHSDGRPMDVVDHLQVASANQTERADQHFDTWHLSRVTTRQSAPSSCTTLAMYVNSSSPLSKKTTR